MTGPSAFPVPLELVRDSLLRRMSTTTPSPHDRRPGADRPYPDERFADLPDFPFEPNHAEIPDGDGGTLRVHYVDEGGIPSGSLADAAPVLLLHGEPSWSYLYRHMIPPLVAAGAAFESATRFRDPLANHWVVDGNLVTGQNQNAAPMVAREMLCLVAEHRVDARTAEPEAPGEDP